MSQKIDISIISSGANIADARLHRITNALLRAGFNVELFAPGDPTQAPSIESIASGSLTPTGKLMVRACTSPWTRGKGLIPRYIRSRTFVMRAKGTVVYAISPEAYAPALAWVGISKVKKLVGGNKRYFAIDIYEDYLRLLEDRRWAKKYFGLLGAIARSDTKWALRAAARADLTTVADIQVPPFAARNRVVLRNLPDNSLLTQSGERSSTPRAIYIGDLRASRGLRTMLDLAAHAQEWHFDLVGPVAAADQEFVDQWLRLHGSERVKFHGKLPPRSAWKVAEGAWVGLSLLEPTPAFVEAVPSKLYEYMAVGLATISTPLPRCVELLALSGAGVVASTSAEMAEILKSWQKKPDEIDQIRARAKAWAEENLDSMTEYGRLTQEFEKILGR